MTTPPATRRPARAWHRRPGRRTTVGVVAVALAGGAVLGSTTTTSAAYTDDATLRLGSTGLGSTAPFDVVLVEDGTARQAGPGAEVRLPGAEDGLVPGRTVEHELVVANNDPHVAAALTLTVDAAPVPGTPDITPHLRVTVLAQDGTALAGDPAAPAAGALPGTPVAVGVVGSRGAGPVPDGAPWAAGADGSTTRVRVLLHYVDHPATAALNGGRATVGLRVGATSVEVAP